MSQKESYWLNKTLPQILRENVAKAPDAPAVMWGDQVMGWGALDLLSDQLAAGLAELGIGRGDVVSCQLGNMPEFLILHHAVAKCRAVFNPIHLPYRSSELEHILGFSESAVLVVGPSIKDFSYLELGLQMKHSLECLHHLVSIGEETAAEVIPFESLKHDSAPPVSAADPEDPFLMLFTSGTTASPKATVHTHNMRLTNSWFCGGDFALREEDHMLCCSALSHMWAVLNYYSSVIYGCPQILLERYRPQDFLATAAAGQATVVIGAPVHAIDLLASPNLDPRALSSIRLFALSGTVCPPQLMRQLTATLPNCKPMVFWGMTETGGGFYTRLEDPPEIVENTAGRASGPCIIGVLDEEGKQLAPGQEGELAIKSPFGISSYLKNPEATAENYTADGWFRTGDLGRMAADGNIQILGRRKEEINRGGTKFLPQAVEEVLLNHPGVHMVAMVGMPDERLGERSVCFMVSVPGEPPPQLEELCALLEKDGMAKFKWPERLEIVEGLPVTPTGKVQRGVLKEWAAKLGD